MRAIFFGDAGRQLFGAYHAAEQDAPERNLAVVLAYPGMPEYNMAHWMFRRLSGVLSRAGFPTLRFDYYGTGDSAGESEDGTLEHWTRDIETAAREVLDLSGAREVSLVGMRLGASLAARAVAGGLAVRDLVLLDPVVSGKKYLRELEGLDRFQRIVRLYPRARPHSELLGFPLPAEVRRDIANLDLLQLAQLDFERFELVATNERPEYAQFVGRLIAAGKDANLTFVPDDSAQARAAEGQAALLSSKPISAIAEALTRARTA